ncbi:MAG: hypothetical protein V3V20_03785 [Algisphaera sp.]
MRNTHLFNTAFSCALISILGTCVSSNATLVISQADTQSLLTFDEDHEGVFVIGTGSNAGGASPAVGEPEELRRSARHRNREGGLLTTGVAIQNKWADKGKITLFGADANGDNDQEDLFGSVQMGVMKADQLPHYNSNALLISKQDNWGRTGVYLRIQNNTHTTITRWTFTADVYYEETTDKGAGNTTFRYAVDNGNDIDAMMAASAFTPFAQAPTATAGATYAAVAYRLNQTITTPGVAQGDHIILAIETPDGITGSATLVDNIGVTAVVTGDSTPPTLSPPTPETPETPGGFVEPE